MSDSFDYVIVGAGSAGCALAHRLSEDPNTTVCLIEAGGQANGLLTRVPLAAVATMPAHLGIKLQNWAFETVPQPGLNGRKGYQPRGKGLGGSSILNAMIYMRGHPKDYDGWRDAGCDGWGYADVLPYFQKAEDFAGGASAHHGAGGPLQVTGLADPHAITQDFVASGQMLQLPHNADFNAGDPYGVGHFHVTQFHDHRRGERCSAAAAYLDPIRSRQNLKILTKAQVCKVLIADQRATGVEIAKGRDREAILARREVILCAGAFQSPQLLMLSGIGPGADLARHGLPVVADLPAVGQNLQDHLDAILSYSVNTTEVIGIGASGAWRLLKGALQWARDGRGPMSTNFAEAGAFFSTGPDGAEWPDTQLHFVVARVEDHARKISWGYAVSCHACVLRPKSRGSVSLTSSDPTAAPSIDPNFLAEEDDLRALMLGTRKAHQIMTQAPMKDRITKSLTITGQESDAELETILRNSADTIYHPVGTCRMGGDAGSVLDPQLRVRGVAGLRVADASVMPTIVSGNTNAPAIMIGEKAADMIRHA